MQKVFGVDCGEDTLPEGELIEPMIAEYLGVQAVRYPPGIAKGALMMATRGTGLLVTVWPNPQNQLRPLPWNHIRGVPLWPQEMAVYCREVAPQINDSVDKIVARQHWEKLWLALEEIPIEEAIENDEPKRESAKQVVTRNRIWSKATDLSEFRSAFCNNQECVRCKQIDCECKCHAGAE